MSIDIARIVQQYVQDLAELSVTTILEWHFEDVTVLPPDRHVASLDEILKQALVADREIRRLFAVDPQAAQLDNPYAGLIDVFSIPTIVRVIRARSADPAYLSDQYIFPLDDSARKPDLTPCTVPDIEAFLNNWEIFTHRVLCKMTPSHWTNVIAAGGSVLASLMAIPLGASARDLNLSYLGHAWGMSDVDLFLYGLSPEQAERKIQDIYEVICASAPWKVTCVRTAATISFRTDYPYRPVQIILRLYRSPAEILAGFDVDSSCCAFDGQRVWVNPRSLTALIRQTNTVDITRRSPSYEVRLAKYAERGFEIYVPSLSRSNINPMIYNRNLPFFPRGLARLLVLERLYESASAYAFLKYPKNRVEIENKVAVIGEDPLQGIAGDTPQLLRSYYDSELRWGPIPYGPQWDAHRIETIIARKDSWLNSSLNHSHYGEQTHRHVIFAGSLQDCIEGIFCERCTDAQGSDGAVEAHASPYIQGRVKFMVEHPGRQMATGSFHPIDDAEWEKDVYLHNTDDLDDIASEASHYTDALSHFST